MKIKGNDKSTRRLLRKRVRLAVIDENRMKRIVNLRVSWWRFITFLIVCLVVLGFFGVLLVVNTRLKAILPGYLYSYERDEMLANTRKIDSLSNEVGTRQQYMDNIIAILNGDVDTTLEQLPPSAEVIPIDSIITASEIEREFMQQYERDQKFNLSVLSPIAAQGITFVNPLTGAEARQPEDGEDERHVTFDMPRLQPVSATYRGTVVDVYNTMDAGYTVLIMHPNDFISRYGGLTEVMVRRGQTVSPGQRIGLIERDKAEKLGSMPSFELWYKETAVNPRNYIPF